jgi:hypothetical protein
LKGQLRHPQFVTKLLHLPAVILRIDEFGPSEPIWEDEVIRLHEVIRLRVLGLLQILSSRPINPFQSAIT